MTHAANQSRRSGKALLAGILGVCVVAGAAAGTILWRWTRPDVPPQNAVVVISGETAGWLTPCGCTSNQSGGLPRRASYLASLRRSAEVIYADAGGAPAGDSAYQRMKFEAILRGEMEMGLKAHNLGGPEAALGPTYLRDAASRLGVPFVSANARDATGAAVAPAIRIVTTGGRRIALAGVLSPRFATPELRVEDPRQALLAAIAASKGTYDSLIVLAYLPEEELKQLAADLPEADAVIGGPTGQAMVPQRLGATLLAAAANKGKFLARLDVPPPPKSHGDAPATPWSGAIVEMDGSWPDDAQQKENVSKYLAELGRADFTAAQTGLATAEAGPAPVDYRVAGTEACAQCHWAAEYQWSHSGHRHAWQSLQNNGSQVDPDCQQCHTTAYGLPGGFASISQSAALTNVGCESCHGPSSSHARHPTTHTPFLAKDQCVRCHDAENSPGFDPAAAWERIVHGLNPRLPGGPVAEDLPDSEVRR